MEREARLHQSFPISLSPIIAPPALILALPHLLKSTVTHPHHSPTSSPLPSVSEIRGTKLFYKHFKAAELFSPPETGGQQLIIRTRKMHWSVKSPISFIPPIRPPKPTPPASASPRQSKPLSSPCRSTSGIRDL